MANEQKLRAYFVDGTFSEPSFIDVMSTPSVNKTDKAGSSFFRTPGQVMSLTSNFTFVSKITQLLHVARINNHTGKSLEKLS